MRPPLIRLKLQPSDARRERAGELLPKGSLHEPDDPEADGQTEYRGGNCKTDLFAHESLEPVSDNSKVGRFTKAATKSSAAEGVHPADVNFAKATGILNPL